MFLNTLALVFLFAWSTTTNVMAFLPLDGLASHRSEHGNVISAYKIDGMRKHYEPSSHAVVARQSNEQGKTQRSIEHAKPITSLQMSSLENEQGNDKNRRQRRKNEGGLVRFTNPFRFPPFPENFLVLGGDVAALFVYSFLDHTINSIYTSILQTAATNGDVSSMMSDALPVHASWIDSMNMPAAFIAQQAPIAVTYAPLLGYAGVSSVLFTSCWLLSGYAHEAFSFKNTVLCDTTHAVVVAGRTWVCAAVAMAIMAWLSDACGCALQDHVGGLTQADAEYIFDSLAVLVTWRFLVNFVLGRF